MPKVWFLVSALQEFQVTLQNLAFPVQPRDTCKAEQPATVPRTEGEMVPLSPPEHQEVLRASSPHSPGTRRPYCTVTENSCSRKYGSSMTQPEGRGGGSIREECCASKNKAVIKDLEFPVAFEPPLTGIMAAALGRSCGSKMKGFVNTQWILFGP